MSKKNLLCVAALVGIAALASCGATEATSQVKESQPDEFQQNGSQFEKPQYDLWCVGATDTFNNWTPATLPDSLKFVYDSAYTSADRYKLVVTVTEDAEFKFVPEKAWNGDFGIEQVDFANSKNYVEKVVGDKNNDGKFDINDQYTFSKGDNCPAKAGTYTIYYYPYNFDATESAVSGGNVSYGTKIVIDYAE